MLNKLLYYSCLVLLHTATAIISTAQPSYAQGLTDQHKAVIQEATDWVSAGNGNTAYQKLLPLKNTLSGIPEFDAVFGQAALHANEPSIAAFAFERCLAMHPSNGICRLGMARAHLELSESSSARNELAILQQSKPPQQVQEAINNYLQRLDGVDRANQDTRLSSYIQWGVGYDSNINNATSSSTVALPLFGNLDFNISRDGRSIESAFAQAKFNIRYSTPLSDQWRLMTEANLSATSNFNNHRYNTTVADASVGLARRANKHQFLFKLQGQNYRLHETNYRNLIGVSGQYSYSVSDRSEATVFAQASRLNYSNSKYFRNNSLRNANRYTLGGTWMQGLASDRAVAYLTGYGGVERTVKSHAPKSYDYNFMGVRTGGMYLLTPRTQIEAGVGIENRRHQGSDPLFLKSRNETLYDAYAGLNYRINRKLSIRPQYRFYKNSSNAKLYGYKRHIFTVNMRYEIF